MKSKNQINIMVASKHPSMQWLSIDEAKAEFDKGLAIWKWVSDDADPDINTRSSVRLSDFRDAGGNKDFEGRIFLI